MTDGFTDAVYRGLPDDAIWACIRERLDEAALRAFLLRNGGRLLASARAFTGDEAAADDTVQESLIRLLRDRAKLANHGAAMAWLYRVVNRTARQFRRAERRRKAREAAVGSARAEGVSPPEVPDASAHVAGAVADLPERERRVVELVYFAGLTHADAAAALGWSRGSVGTYVGRALKRLEGALAKRGVTAAGGVASLLTAQSEAAVQTRLTPALLAAQASAPVSGIRAMALLAGSVVLALAVVGLSARPNREAAPPVSLPPVSESLPARNLRLFHGLVLPELLATLKPLTSDGAVTLVSADAFDTRLDATFALRSSVVSRVRYLSDLDANRSQVFLEALGRGRFDRLLQPIHGEPSVVLRPWTGGPQVKLQVDPFAAGVKAFARLPPDPRLAVEGESFRIKFAADLRDKLGNWRHHGNPAEVWRLSWPSGEDRPRLAAPAGHWWSLADGRAWYRLEPDGPLGRRLLAEDEPVEFSPDGRRLTFTRTGEWWDRAED